MYESTNRIRRGDIVKVLVGKDRGRTGKILHVNPKASRATVEGVNIYTRHERSRRQGQKGQTVQVPMPLHASNLMLICPHCKKATRVGFEIDEKGIKSRVCKKCGKAV